MAQVSEPSFEELQEKVARLERELASCRLAERAYHTMLSSSSDSLFMVDRESRYLFINNNHLLNRLNIPIEDVLGKKYGDFHDSEKTAEFSRLLEEVFTGGDTIHREIASGSKGMHFLRSFRPVRDSESSERINAVLVATCNISELKRTEASLQRNKAIYRELVDAIDSMVFLKDHTSRYILGNKAFLNWVHKGDDELQGQTDYDLFPAEIAEILEQLEKESLKSGSNPIISSNLIEGRIFEIKAFAMELNKEVQGLGGLISDITERVKGELEKERLELQFLQAQKMEAIGTLAGGIAHDFNNLLMGIQGYISLILFDLDQNHPHYEKLRNVEQQVKNGSDLTKQLLGFARGGKYEIKLTDLNEVIAKVAAVFGRTKKDIVMCEFYEQDLWATEVDRGQMEQVLLNLFVNAHQAMPDGGTLYLKTNNCLVHEGDTTPYYIQPGRYVEIEVTDTGEGMDELVRERIFEPFFTTKEMGRGTGLGLATVYGIIKAHGGFIQVESSKGRGTTFRIYLPASDGRAGEDVENMQELSHGSETILLVDDERAVLEVTKELLEMLGYEIITASSGSEAVARYREKKDLISLVILDMIMPGMSGGDVFDRLLEINPQIKVILSSGYSLNHKVTHILQQGCREFLQKPFSCQELSRIIRKTLSEGGI